MHFGSAVGFMVLVILFNFSNLDVGALHEIGLLELGVFECFLLSIFIWVLLFSRISCIACFFICSLLCPNRTQMHIFGVDVKETILVLILFRFFFIVES